MVFPPKGSLLLMPGTMVHGGGYMTGPGGNVRMHYVLFLVDATKTKSWKAAMELNIITKEFTQTYIGEADGSGEVPHSFSVDVPIREMRTADNPRGKKRKKKDDEPPEELTNLAEFFQMFGF